MGHEDQFSDLVAAGLTVRQLAPYQFRIADRFDVYPNDKGREWAWHDLKLGDRGVKPPEQFKFFAMRRVREV